MTVGPELAGSGGAGHPRSPQTLFAAIAGSRPDLSATNLIEASLRRANLEGADLNNSGLIDAVI